MVGALAVAFAAALWQAPSAFRQLDARASAYTHERQLPRSLVAAVGEGIDPNLLLVARRVIPRSATYELITGTATRGTPPSALVAITPFAAYWLLPRKQLAVGASVQPDWVISYGGTLASLHLRFARIVRVAVGLVVAQVSR